MLKWFQSLDHDQKTTIISSSVIIFIAMLAGIFLPVKFMLFIFPLQFLITYFMFCSKQTAYSEPWCIDEKSNKRWKISSCDLFPNIGLTSSALFGAIAIGNPSKFVAIFALLCPLLLTRAIIFLRKLPLDALYVALFKN